LAGVRKTEKRRKGGKEKREKKETLRGRVRKVLFEVSTVTCALLIYSFNIGFEIIHYYVQMRKYIAKSTQRRYQK
jgi:cell division protein FtsB